MAVNFRPAKREDTPLIVGLAGPTKSGKTLSAHRLARGLAGPSGAVAMINAEGARGNQYADRFEYSVYDLEPPYSPARYIDALEAVRALRPAVLIIDSMSHMHDGPGGLLEMHDDELDRMAGTTDYKKRDRMNFTAWIRPKKLENEFIYTLLSLNCHAVLCFRAKEKLKIVRGAEPIDLGYQPIASDRVAFETMFTLLLPPHCKGVPDLNLSEMREPFDELIPIGKPIDEALGARLAKWSAGLSAPKPEREPFHDNTKGGPGNVVHTPDAMHVEIDDNAPRITANQAADLEIMLSDIGVPVAWLTRKAGVDSITDIRAEHYQRAVAAITAKRGEVAGGAAP